VSPSETLPRTIAAELRRRIAAGELRPGDRLPGHRELAGTFSVSLGSVREAISMLVSSGLIETRPARGTFVIDPASELVLAAPLERKEAVELIEARELLELQLAELAAERATQLHVAALRDAIDTLAASVGTPSSYNDADRSFHAAIAIAAGNRFLLGALEGIRLRLQGDLELAADAAFRRFGNLDFSVVAHRELVDAIEGRDAGTARRRLLRLMRRSHEFVLGLYALAPGTEHAADEPRPVTSAPRPRRQR
jgi:GntR family transcriptional regulator, transcriptional repressor for pyruvate dehydrogenase complex